MYTYEIILGLSPLDSSLQPELSSNCIDEKLELYRMLHNKSRDNWHDVGKLFVSRDMCLNLIR